jgi:MoaA/NifB/PqqE/SkfB family radical SAM enzyme
MCYQTDFSAKLNMPSSIYREALSDVYQWVEVVKLIGGEPTIMKNCREVASLLRTHPNARLSVTTNGVRVDDFWHETFIDQCEWVSFSINAASKAAYDRIVIWGDFAKVIRNIERLVADRKGALPSIGLSAVILKDNVFEMNKLIRLAASIGVDQVSFVMDPILSRASLPPTCELRSEVDAAKVAQIETGIRVEGLDTFEKYFVGDHAGLALVRARKMCTMPFHNLVVDWNGDVRICCNTWVKVGNLNKTTLPEILTGPALLAFRRRMQESNYLWCNPGCDDNPSPHRFALVHKAWSLASSDPRLTLKKTRHKFAQLAGLGGSESKKRPAGPSR